MQPGYNEINDFAKRQGVLMYNDPLFKPTSRDIDFTIQGMSFEATRHNSKAENLWQTLNAFVKIVQKSCSTATEEELLVLNNAISLVDQCLIENKPDIL